MQYRLFKATLGGLASMGDAFFETAGSQHRILRPPTILVIRFSR